MSDSLFFVLVLVGLPAFCISVWVFRYRMNQAGRRRGTAGAQRWALDGGLRLVSGEAPGVTRRWRFGRLVVEPGQLTLRPCLVGLRFLPGRPVTVTIADVDLAGEREAGLKDVLGVKPGTRLVPLTTTTGAGLEMALVASKTDQLFATLAARPAAAA